MIEELKVRRYLKNFQVLLYFLFHPQPLRGLEPSSGRWEMQLSQPQQRRLEFVVVKGV